MPKNILIFIDGTGNQGGLLPDESRTNVYKLFRATRAGPDSSIDPSKQIAFYVHGIGTSGSRSSFSRRCRNVTDQMFGGGFTSRVIEGYLAAISSWQPGDRIYLFGFSRGAYIARCVAHVLELCGVPTKQSDGTALSLKPGDLRKIAKRAVRVLYRFGMPTKDNDKRQKSVNSFRADYGSLVGAEIGALPYFIGVWDTVAAIGWKRFFPKWSYDLHYPRDVAFGRHAMAIDEYRKHSLACHGAAVARSGQAEKKMFSSRLSKFGSRETIPTLGEAIQRTSRDCPTFRWAGWSIS
jgi:uncharacterized protein (DUF2235 family)